MPAAALTQGDDGVEAVLGEVERYFAGRPGLAGAAIHSHTGHNALVKQGGAAAAARRLPAGERPKPERGMLVWGYSVALDDTTRPRSS